MTHHFYFNCPVGPCYVEASKGGAAPDDDCYVSYFVFWGGEKESAPKDVRFSIVVEAVSGGCHEHLNALLGTCVPSGSFAEGWGEDKALKWRPLRNAVIGGARLQASIALTTASDPASTDTRLRIGPPPGATLLGDSLLGGPFCDVAVRAGGRQWRAHRVVLAAASPALLGMLGGEMLEAQAAAVEFKEADEQVVELLLRHIYGEAIEVPLELLPALYGLADQYQLRSSLCMEARLLLSTVSVQPAALARLLPAVHHLCCAAFDASWCDQAAEALPKLQPCEYSAWPLDVFADVSREARPLPDVLTAANAWVEGQDAPGAAAAEVWDRLLDAVDWAAATRDDLRAVQQRLGSSGIPGLHAKLYEALDALYIKMHG
ncbi:hypothetical protein MNEG_11010 [Monoraphidium neglectum]|uniref:BTB domain-containing protein n=1 Tax=Monoraphidium neglectum TaxID=145388 RepID=A0A0D2MQP2_9CHLO|nr:hypothetical protein MNEG_11010 [Monoraphidium neglectum]KIY96950.1 hypothetical protein MNEG_11010 [Monoraphidium neglectum]|eukprot:XP_013895970.1 hypothetical protein MNEG_11010 [Monoraphidium neglectum]